MLNADTLKFLKELKKNNNREWFAVNKPWYDKARVDFEALVGKLLDAVNTFDPSVGHPEPKKCIFRIYRDTRFSSNKEPYKSNFGATLCSEEHRKGIDRSSYYTHLEQGNCFLSCGVYMPSPAVLKALRLAVHDDFDTLFDILHKKDFEKTFGDLVRDEDALQRVPTGFDKTHPSSEYLKLKHFYVFYPVKDEDICSSKFIDNATAILKKAKPLNDWLNKVIENAAE